ncbi:hypothetical protein pipiens_005572 [Culex pipiens pipiens]|uniref:Uncharacterized protein n=1 Tax=Culex pipiens pipiens TaxID=38569 RepID=A0ABD1DVK1_CULPP
MNQPRSMTSKYDKELEDEQMASNINVIDKALHGNRDPLLKDPIWTRQNEINKSMFAKVNLIEQLQTGSLVDQQSFNKAVAEEYHKLPLSQELTKTATTLEATAHAVDDLKEAQQAMRSELSDDTKGKTSLEIRLDSVEALLKDISERLNETFINMETMTQEIEALQQESRMASKE